MDAAVDLTDLLLKSCQLHHEWLQRLSHWLRQLRAVGAIDHDRDQTLHAVLSLCRDQTELSQVSAQRIDKLRTLAD